MVWWRRRWVLLKKVHCDLDRRLELRIVTRAHRLGIVFYLHVGRDTVVLHVPSSIGVVEGQVRRAGRASVQQILRIRVVAR